MWFWWKKTTRGQSKSSPLRNESWDSRGNRKWHLKPPSLWVGAWCYKHCNAWLSWHCPVLLLPSLVWRPVLILSAWSSVCLLISPLLVSSSSCKVSCLLRFTPITPAQIPVDNSQPFTCYSTFIIYWLHFWLTSSSVLQILTKSFIYVSKIISAFSKTIPRWPAEVLGILIKYGTISRRWWNGKSPLGRSLVNRKLSCKQLT